MKYLVICTSLLAMAFAGPTTQPPTTTKPSASGPTSVRPSVTTLSPKVSAITTVKPSAKGNQGTTSVPSKSTALATVTTVKPSDKCYPSLDEWRKNLASRIKTAQDGVERVASSTPGWFNVVRRYGLRLTARSMSDLNKKIERESKKGDDRAKLGSLVKAERALDRLASGSLRKKWTRADCCYKTTKTKCGSAKSS